MRPRLLTLLSSVLIVLSFPPWGFYPLIWVALIPWFTALKKTKNSKEAFFQGLWLSFFMSILGFYWVGYVLHEFAELPWPLATIGLLLYGIIGQPQFWLFAPLFRWLEVDPTGNRRISNLLLATTALAFLYTGVDWMIPKLFVDTLGHSFWNANHLRQAADLGGAALLTFVIYWVNDALWKVFESRKNIKTQFEAWFPHLTIAGALVLSLFVYGQFRESEIQAIVNGATRHIRLGVIQANIGDFDKEASQRGVRDAAIHVLNKFFTMSDQAIHRNSDAEANANSTGVNPTDSTNIPDAVVWPETSYPSTFRTPSNFMEMQRDHDVEDYVRTRKTSVLFGGYDRKDGRDYNAFFFLSPEVHTTDFGVGDIQVYRKNILLLFGEYIPMSDTFTFLKTAFPQVGNFGRGSGPEVLSVYPRDTHAAPVKVGPIICYEALFPNYIIAAARKGSEMILNITNDSWFGPYGEPILHFSLITFRSIETRLPQLRSTNTGISALILPDGTVSERSQIGTEEILNANVPITPPIWTLMKAWGDWFGPFSLVMGLVLVMFAGLKLATPARR